MNNATWLALDQGGHSSRALVFNSNGEVVAQAARAIHTHRDGERVEHDATELLQSLKHCLAEIQTRLGNNLRHVRAAGLATQRSSIVCWDRITGEPLSPVLSWQDRRQHEWLSQLAAQRDHIEQTTGLVLSAHYGASKLRWCLDHLPAVQQARATGRLCMGPLASFLLSGLLIERPCVVDPANASRTQLWSPATRQWSADLLTTFGVPAEVLPACVPTAHLYGHLAFESAAGPTLPLVICTGDQAAVPYAAGELQLDTLYLNIGTGAFALAPLADADARHVTDARPLLRSVLWSDEHQVISALEGTVNGAAAALSWLAAETGEPVHAIASTLDRAALIDSDLPIFINGIGGVGSPFWLPQLNSQWWPMTAPLTHSLPRRVAAVVESIAFLIHANVEALQARQPLLRQLCVGGGLAQNDYLCHCLSALTGLRLRRLQEPELTAKGVMMLIRQRCGDLPAPAAVTGQVFEPAPWPGLQQRQQRWLAAMHQFMP